MPSLGQSEEMAKRGLSLGWFGHLLLTVGEASFISWNKTDARSSALKFRWKSPVLRPWTPVALPFPDTKGPEEQILLQPCQPCAESLLRLFMMRISLVWWTGWSRPPPLWAADSAHQGLRGSFLAGMGGGTAWRWEVVQVDVTTNEVQSFVQWAQEREKSCLD